jgi:hypothetical protein
MAITLKIFYKSTQKYPGSKLHMLINIPVKFHDSRSNLLWVTCDTSWKLQIFTKSRALLYKYWINPQAKPKVHNYTCCSFHSTSNHFWVTCDTCWKLQKFSTSRAIALKILNKSRQKYPDAKLHMLINIPVKFHDSWSNPLWVTCDTSWKLQIFTKSMAITLKILNISAQKCPVAQLHYTCWSTFL